MEKIYSALIVDDELLARQDLKSILDGFSQIDILAEADSISSAREKIREQRPDIVFLDIELTGETGFDLSPFAHDRFDHLTGKAETRVV